jgi:soluble lytic murein transglycosylase-like protein
MKKEELQALAIKIAEEHKLRHEWVCAIIQIESNWDYLAVRYEPHYKWLYKPAYFSKLNNITFETENVLQCMSFGPMQAMGSIFRELGFSENLLKVTDPNISLKYGCLKLHQLISKYGYTMDAIASYNAGGPYKTNGVYRNKDYVDKFLKALGGSHG